MKGLEITAADAALFARDSVRVETEVSIRCSAEDAFNYATTPALWHTWHPATVSVQDVPNRPLIRGETMRELIAVAGRRDEAVWKVLVCDAPQRWEIGTDTEAGTAHIVYRVTPTSVGCRFHRTLDFRSKRWPWRALDSTLTRWILERQSERALHNLKAVLERQS